MFAGALPAAAAAIVSAAALAAAPPRGCAWGAGAAVPQPGGNSDGSTTCTPPAVLGPGSATVAAPADRYVDIQAFQYPPLRTGANVTPAPAPRWRTGGTKVAIVAHGADGCSACRGCPKVTPAEW